MTINEKIALHNLINELVDDNCRLTRESVSYNADISMIEYFTRRVEESENDLNAFILRLK